MEPEKSSNPMDQEGLVLLTFYELWILKKSGSQIVSRLKIKSVGCIRHFSGLESMVMENMAAGRQGQD